MRLTAPGPARPAFHNRTKITQKVVSRAKGLTIQPNLRSARVPVPVIEEAIGKGSCPQRCADKSPMLRETTLLAATAAGLKHAVLVPGSRERPHAPPRRRRQAGWTACWRCRRPPPPSGVPPANPPCLRVPSLCGGSSRRGLGAYRDFDRNPQCPVTCSRLRI